MLNQASDPLRTLGWEHHRQVEAANRPRAPSVMGRQCRSQEGRSSPPSRSGKQGSPGLEEAIDINIYLAPTIRQHARRFACSVTGACRIGGIIKHISQKHRG